MKFTKSLMATSMCLLAIFLSNSSYAGNKMTNLEIVKSTYEGKNSEENGQNLQRHVAANIRWKEADGFPYAGVYIGMEAISKNVFQRLATEWIDYRFTVEDYVASDNKVMAYGTYTGTNKATNKYFEARVAHLWKLQDGKITSFEQFVDSHKVVETLPK